MTSRSVPDSGSGVQRHDTVARPSRRGCRASTRSAGQAATVDVDLLYGWVDNRFAISRGLGGSLLNKIFPDHWSFMIGEIALYAFVVLVLTGIFLSRSTSSRRRTTSSTTAPTSRSTARSRSVQSLPVDDQPLLLGARGA